jgi:hypothetical protein
VRRGSSITDFDPNECPRWEESIDNRSAFVVMGVCAGVCVCIVGIKPRPPPPPPYPGNAPPPLPDVCTFISTMSVCMCVFVSLCYIRVCRSEGYPDSESAFWAGTAPSSRSNSVVALPVEMPRSFEPQVRDVAL